MAFITTSNPTYYSLFENLACGNEKYVLTIPPYQRPFVWSVKKVEALMNDWSEYISSIQCQKGIDYYMGTIIIHRDQEGKLYNVVDGQQRLTTLLIIDRIMNGQDSALSKYSASINFSFSNEQSNNNIRKISRLCKMELSIGKRARRLIDNTIFKHLRFTIIMTDSEDDAFTFFDSQNNRGIQPSAVDVLKAVHLRAIHNDETLQKSCAHRWEQAQNTGKNPFLSKNEMYMCDLIETALWRLRTWKGHSFDNFSCYESVMGEFSDKLKTSNDNTVRVYSVPTSYKIAINSDLSIDNEESHFLSSYKEIPFSIRQPLNKGVTFFAYIDIYDKIAKTLFVDESKDEEVCRMRMLFKRLYVDTGCSSYMSDYFIMLMIFYYDKFGNARLYHFSLCLDSIIGQLRLDNYYFRREAMMKYTMKNNLIDKLQICYEPDEVIDDMKSIILEVNHNIPPDNNPIRRYKTANCGFFHIRDVSDSDFVKEKINQIKNIIENEQ